MSWIIIRTLSTQAAEAAVASAVVELDQEAPGVEFRFSSLTFGGSPKAVSFAFWRGSGGKIEKLGEATILSSELDRPEPIRFAVDAKSVAVTVASFAEGTSPTVSGTVEARPVFNEAGTASESTLKTLQPSPIYKPYAVGGALGGDVNLVSDGGGYSRQISVGTAGTLVVVRPDNTEITIPQNTVDSIKVFDIAAKTLKSTSTAQDILVLW